MRTKLKVALYAGAPLLEHSFKISLRQQVLRSWNYSCDQRLKVSHIFVDQSTSESLAERPNFRQMINDARARMFDIIVFCGLEYLCSSQAELTAAKKSLKESGARFSNAVKMDGL
jgi:hypothetical protein